MYTIPPLMALVALLSAGSEPRLFLLQFGVEIGLLYLTSCAAISCVMTLTRGRILSCETNYSRLNFSGDVIRHLLRQRRAADILNNIEL